MTTRPNNNANKVLNDNRVTFERFAQLYLKHPEATRGGVGWGGGPAESVIV